MLVVQSDEDPAAASAEIAAIEAICAAHGATECHATADAEEGAAFVHARRMAIPAVERLGRLLLEDVGVPIPRLADLVLGIARIAAEQDVPIAVIAHAGDGNTHPLLVVDPADAAQQARAEVAYGRVMDLAIELGGTITGEHGVGRLKRSWLGAQIGPDALELNRRIKTALDPQGILNPGAILEPDPTPERSGA
jgi:glycolate oxidase